MEKSSGQLAKELSILIAIAVIGLVVLDKSTNIFETVQEKNEDNFLAVDIPDYIPEYDGTGGLDEPTSIEIYNTTTTYTPTDKAFTDNYKKESVSLALKGQFATAEFIIKGNTTNEERNVLSVNIQKISGIYGISRLKNKGINVSDSKAIFGKDNPLNLSIDLMNQTRLSATLKEIENGIAPGHKDLYLWQLIQPPAKDGTVVEFLFVPFSQDGTIGETTITELQFQYRCVDKGECHAELCKADEKGSKCLQKIDPVAAQKYINFFNN